MEHSMTQEPNIKWPLIWSLIALNAAIIISWIAYHNYQPKLLDRFGFIDLDNLLGYSKLLVMATVPPLAGFLADRMRSKYRNSLPFVSIGVSITALIFMTVAATITPESLLPLSGALPIMIILWLISMNLFYAPALATLEEFVPPAQFTLVMGVFILVSDLVYALEPAIILLVDTLGASLTFITGGVLIGVSGYFFSRLYKSHEKPTTFIPASTEDKNGKHLTILAIGLCLGFVVAYLMNVVPKILGTKLPSSFNNIPIEIIISLVLILTAITAYLISKRLANKRRSKLFKWSFLAALLAFALINVLPGQFALSGFLLLIPAIGIMSLTAFPMAISKIGYNDKMLAAGLFVAGLEIPDSLLELFY